MRERNPFTIPAVISGLLISLCGVIFDNIPMVLYGGILIFASLKKPEE